MLAYNPPHSPYECMDDCMEEDYDLYRNMDYSELYVRENADTTLTKAPSARYYFANVTGVDREFGRLLDELEKLGLEDNTIVVFTSDHGETMCSHSTYDPKNSIYTESYCVPFMIRYPDRIRHRDTGERGRERPLTRLPRRRARMPAAGCDTVYP